MTSIQANPTSTRNITEQLSIESLSLSSSSNYDSSASSICQAEVNPFPAPQSVQLTSEINVGEANIPLINLDEIRNALTPDIRKAKIKEFGDALKNVGFIAVKAESLTPIIQRVNIEMNKYFRQTLEQKMNDWHDNNGQTGYSPQGTETAAGATVADRKELFFIPPNFEKWPKDNQEFKTVMKEYHAELTKYAGDLMEFITEYLEENIQDVKESINTATNLLRLAHYFAANATDDPQSVWAAEHTDLNALTLLPRSLVPGLQLKKNEEWLAVNAPDDYLIVNTGEQLECKTAGTFKAILHRVVNPGGMYASLERFASIFFASWHERFSLKPYAKCLEQATEAMTSLEKEEYIKNYPNVNVKENLISRLIEMGAIKEPNEELVADLYQKGLLRRPPRKIIDQFSHIFQTTS